MEGKTDIFNDIFTLINVEKVLIINSFAKVIANRVLTAGCLD
jgi:hypothetical protein